MKALLFLFFVSFPTGILQDTDKDGIVDYANIRVYVADDPTSKEVAAAANVAARSAFESLLINLPIGHLLPPETNN